MRDAELKIKIHRQGLADRAKFDQLINQYPLFNQVKRVIEVKISFQEQQVFICFVFFNETNLHADGQVDPGSEGSADSARRQAEVFEELGEGLRQGQAGALLGDHHAAPHARQIHTPRLDTHTALSVTDGYLFYYYLSCWYQEALWQHSANSGRTLTFSISVWVPRPLVHSSMTE